MLCLYVDFRNVHSSLDSVNHVDLCAVPSVIPICPVIYGFQKTIVISSAPEQFCLVSM